MRQNNALQTLSKQVDPASKNICEEYVRLKPDLNPKDVMVAYLSVRECGCVAVALAPVRR